MQVSGMYRSNIESQGKGVQSEAVIKNRGNIGYNSCGQN